MIKIKKLRVAYHNKVALNISEEIVFNEGDRIAILGSNGAGKSTLLKSILGLVKYDGHIEIDEKIAVHMQENEYTEFVNVKTVIEAVINDKIKNCARIQELIAYFDFEKCLKQKFKELSGGQKQRLTLILVLYQDFQITFFDEVTSGLDSDTRSNLMEMIRNYYSNKNTMVGIVSHYYEEIEGFANKILLLDKGCVICYGTITELFEKYCGRAVYILDSTTINLSDYKIINGPVNKIVIGVDSINEEEKLNSYLVQNQVNFKRSNMDVEILVYNAKHNYYEVNYEK